MSPQASTAALESGWNGDSLEGLGWGSPVWVRVDQSWIPGTLASSAGAGAPSCEVTLETGQPMSVSTLDVVPANPGTRETSPDLTALPFVTEPGLLRCLDRRFSEDAVYTQAGPVLVAVNPFKTVPLYDVHAHRSNPDKASAPHIYTMQLTGRNQSILITGESGAGKTETTKFAMQYLAVLAGGTGMERRVLESNPLLEAFGNARTLLNANSSRFGKLTTIHFDERHAIRGADIQTYLLEKSRVVRHGPGERSFHAFYQLLAGASDAERLELFLPPPNECRFAYLTPGQGSCGMSGRPSLAVTAFPAVELTSADREGYHQVAMAMDVLGVPRSPVLRTLALVLWLGNIAFEGDEEGCEVSNAPGSRQALAAAAALLAVAEIDLAAALTQRALAAGGERLHRCLSPTAAHEGRDALAKALYARLFDWLVGQVNAALATGATTRASSLAVLDIYGFESFAQNSFEQLCINYANERLQQQFNAHLLRLEQAEYRAEGIPWADVAFADNQDCVDLLEARPPAGTGVLSLLDEECLFPTGTDTSFGEKLRRVAGAHPRFAYDTRAPGTDFVIRHAAGPVRYTCAGMLDKNRDTLAQDLVLLAAGSGDEFIAALAEPLIVREGERRPVSGTVGSRFRDQLRGLVAGLDASALHFVRCLRPNGDAVAGRFDPGAVLHQLRCAGVLEVVRVARAGFPVRHTHAAFAAAYHHLILTSGVVGELSNTETEASGNSDDNILSTCLRLVETFGIGENDHRVGRTRLFFRAGVLARLEDRAARVARAALVLQTLWRGTCARREFLSIRESIIRIQAAWRGAQARKQAAALRARQENAARALQAAARGWAARRALEKQRAAAAVLQAAWRARRAALAAAAASLIVDGEIPQVVPVRRTATVTVDEAAGTVVSGAPESSKNTAPAPGQDMQAQLDAALAARQEAELDLQLLRAELEQLQKMLLTVTTMQQGGEGSPSALQAAWAPGRNPMTGEDTASPGLMPHPKLLAGSRPRTSESGAGRGRRSLDLADDISFMSLSEEGDSSVRTGGVPTPSSSGFTQEGRTPSPTHVPHGPQGVTALGREFDRKTALFDDDAAFIAEVARGEAEAPGMDAEAELATLALRYRKWKAGFKQRLAAAEKALRSANSRRARRAFGPFGR